MDHNMSHGKSRAEDGSLNPMIKIGVIIAFNADRSQI
jgi:hypothetical protein